MGNKKTKSKAGYYYKCFEHKPLRPMRLIILHHLHFIWWEVEGSWSWKETYFFPLLLKTSFPRQLHVLCQSWYYLKPEPPQSLQPFHCAVTDVISVIFRMPWQTTFLSSKGTELTAQVYCYSKEDLVNVLNLQLSPGLTACLKYRKCSRQGRGRKYGFRDLKWWSLEKLQFAQIRAGLHPDFPGRWHMAMVRCLQLSARCLGWVAALCRVPTAGSDPGISGKSIWSYDPKGLPWMWLWSTPTGYTSTA